MTIFQEFIVDCEAYGTTPYSGIMTEFAAINLTTRETFHGRLYNVTYENGNHAKPIPVGNQLESYQSLMGRFAQWIYSAGADRPIFISDNPAYDFMWIACTFDQAGMQNPFGYSGRRIGDIYSGAVKNLKASSQWKRFRQTPHTHNPVDDVTGNAEAFEYIVNTLNIQR